MNLSHQLGCGFKCAPVPGELSLLAFNSLQILIQFPFYSAELQQQLPQLKPRQSDGPK